MVDRLPGRFGAYVLLEKLGAGATGSAWLAVTTDGRRARRVIKILDPELGRDPELVDRFRHEAEIAVCIDSRHVATVFDAGAVGGELFVSMEYLPGWTLAEVLSSLVEQHVVPPVEAVIDLISGGLLGLHAIHTAVDARSGRALDAVHRDITPRNLIVGRDGQTRIIDLGLGRSILQSWRTRTGQVLGSPGYLAPEQVDAAKVDLRADLYSIAVVLFEALVLERYIAGGSVAEMLRRTSEGAFRPPSRLRPDLPKALDPILERALARRPEDRYASALELLRALRAVVPGRDGDRFRAVLDRLALPPRTDETALPDTQPPAGEDPPPEPTTTVVFARRAVLPQPIAAPAPGPPRWAIAVLAIAVALSAALIIVALKIRSSGSPPAITVPATPPRAGER